MFKRLPLIVLTATAVATATIAGLSWARSGDTEPLSVRFATPDTWPVFIELDVNGAQITRQPILGGIFDGKVKGVGAIVVRVPEADATSVALDIIWSDYQTGEVYRAAPRIMKDDVAQLYEGGGMEMTIAVGPLGRLSVWVTSAGFREFAPGSAARRERLAAQPDLVDLQPVLRICGDRFESREAEFADFLAAPPSTRHKRLIDPGIAAQAQADLGPCDPNRQDGL